MNRLEKAVVLGTLSYTAAFVLWPWCAPDLHSRFLSRPHGVDLYMALLVLGVGLGIFCVGITVHDLRARSFVHPKGRVIWSIVAFLGGTPGWLVYLGRHGFRARQPTDERAA